MFDKSGPFQHSCQQPTSFLHLPTFVRPFVRTSLKRDLRPRLEPSRVKESMDAAHLSFLLIAYFYIKIQKSQLQQKQRPTGCLSNLIGWFVSVSHKFAQSQRIYGQIGFLFCFNHKKLRLGQHTNKTRRMRQNS